MYRMSPPPQSADLHRVLCSTTRPAIITLVCKGWYYNWIRTVSPHFIMTVQRYRLSRCSFKIIQPSR